MTKSYIASFFSFVLMSILVFSPLVVVAESVADVAENTEIVDTEITEVAEEGETEENVSEDESINSSETEPSVDEADTSEVSTDEGQEASEDQTTQTEEEISTEEDSEENISEDESGEEQIEAGVDLINSFKDQVVKDLVEPLVTPKAETVIEDSSITFFEEVELGTVYSHSSNAGVQVVFTLLPENPGSLSIEEITLTDEQVEEFGALSNVAYDITSSMENGTFEYDLKLPAPKDKKVSKVVYAEDVKDLETDNVIEVEEEKISVDSTDESVSVNDLDHFTIFIVTSFEEDQTTDPEVGYNGIWFAYGAGGDELEKVISGTNGITSSVGNYHGEMTGTAFTRWDGYKTEFPQGGYDTRVDVYLDMTLADGTVDKRFDFSSAISTPEGGHRRDFIFHLGTNPTVAGEWFVSATNNAPGHPGKPQNNPVTLTETGWYTLEHQFRDVDGVLEVTLNIYKKGENTPIGSWVRTTAIDEIGVTVGGNRYGWFVGSDFDMLAIDQAEIEYIVPSAPTVTIEDPTPEEGTYVRGTITGRALAVDDFGMGSYYLRFWKDAFEIANGGTLVKNCQSAPGGDLLGTEVDASCEFDTKTQEDGLYIFSAQFLDSDIKWGIAKREFYIDNTKPVSVLEHPSETQTIFNSSDVEFEISATDNLALNRIVGNIYKDGSLFKSNSKTISGDSGTYVIDISSIPEGSYTLRYNASDKAGNISQTKTFDFTIDNTAPTITIKPESVGNGSDTFKKVSFKLYDKYKIDKVEINGVVKDLSNNQWSDVNGVKPGVFGAKEGKNTIIVFDVAGNTTELEFILDTTAPTVTIKDDSVGNGVDLFKKVSFKLFDAYKIDKVEINGVLKNLTDNKWSDVNGVKPGVFGAVEGDNTMVVYDVAGNTTTVEFTLDTQAPTIPEIIAPTSEQSFASTPILNQWTESTDATDITYQVAYGYDDEHTFGGSTCADVTEIDGKFVSGCRDTSNTSRSHTPNITEQGGVTVWVRAIDELGNTSDWSTGVHYYYEVPEVTTTEEDDGNEGGGSSDDEDSSNETEDENEDNTETDNTEEDTPKTTEEPFQNRTSSRVSGGGSGSSNNDGDVLGASTDDELCDGMYITSYMKEGSDNDSAQVSLLQSFLNLQGFAVPVTGFFGSLTTSAVMGFQNKYAEEILKPWGIVEATGNVFQTTRWKINNLACEGSEEFPVLN